MTNRKAGWVIALAFILSVIAVQQMKLEAAAKREAALWKEVYKWQEQSSAAIKQFRQPLATTQPESWVAPLMRPVGGAK